MATWKAFDSYVLRIEGGNGSSWSNCIAHIHCYLGDTFVGKMHFWTIDPPRNARLWHSSPGRESIELNFRINLFDSVLSVCRTEEPLVLFINRDTGSGNYTEGNGQLITSEKEPVGDEEGI